MAQVSKASRRKRIVTILDMSGVSDAVQVCHAVAFEGKQRALSYGTVSHTGDSTGVPAFEPVLPLNCIATLFCPKTSAPMPPVKTGVIKLR